MRLHFFNSAVIGNSKLDYSNFELNLSLHGFAQKCKDTWCLSRHFVTLKGCEELNMSAMAVRTALPC